MGAHRDSVLLGHDILFLLHTAHTIGLIEGRIQSIRVNQATPQSTRRSCRGRRFVSNSTQPCKSEVLWGQAAETVRDVPQLLFTVSLSHRLSLTSTSGSLMSTRVKKFASSFIANLQRSNICIASASSLDYQRSIVCHQPSSSSDLLCTSSSSH